MRKALTLCLLICQPALADGPYPTFSGISAGADDAGVAGTNPAAMTRLKQSEFLAGPQVLVVDIKFDTEQSSFGGGNGAF